MIMFKIFACALAVQVFSIVSIVAENETEEPKVEVDDGVLVLTQDNFDSVIGSTEFVLAEFYAPWCGHCKNLAPEYAKAAQELAEAGSPVKLAKVDATVEKELGSKFGIRGYPTLKFFRNGTPMDYNGGRTKDTIVSWLKKKSGPPAISVTESSQLEKLKEENQVFIAGFFEDEKSDEAEAFLKVAATNDDNLFGICTDADLRKASGLEKQGIVLFKKFDEKRAELTEDLTLKSITDFVSEKSMQLFTEFTQEAAQKLFSDKDTPFLFVAMSKKSDAYEKAEETFSTLARDMGRGKFRAVLLNTDNTASKQVIKYLDIKEEDYPTYRILHLEKGLKYKPDVSDLDSEKVAAFVKSFIDGELKPFLKSEEVPENWAAENVKVLVGKNFKEVALDDSKHVLVEFYAPWCGHCKKLTPIWDELAAKYASSEDVIIAKMDSTQNEVEEVTIQGFPTLKFFPANSNGEIVDYKGDRTLDGFVKFLSTYSPPPAEAEVKPETPAETAEEAKEQKKDEL